MKKLCWIFLIIGFTLGVLQFAALPSDLKIVLQYIQSLYLGALFFLLFKLLSKFEKEKNESSKILDIHEKRKNDIYKLRQQLHESNRTLNSILAQDGQAYLTFTRDGKVSSSYSRSCIELLEAEPGNKHIFEVLKVSSEEEAILEEWIGILFNETIDFEDAAPLGPVTYSHSKGLKIDLDYGAIRNEAGEVLSVLVVATDNTDIKEITLQAQEKKEESDVIAKLIKQKESFIFFSQEFSDGVQLYKDLSRSKEFTLNHLKTYLRFLHGVKGGFMQIGLATLGKEIHEIESKWGNINKNSSEMINIELQNDLVFLQESWAKFITKYSRILGYSLDNVERIIEFKLSEAIALYEDLSIVSIPESINETFKTKLTKSIGKYFEQYQDLLIDIATNLKKEIYPLKMSGEELKVMPEAYKNLFVSIGHLFRNSIDHGIESPERRVEMNKDPIGSIDLSFRREARILHDGKEKLDCLIIEVKDDGRGIDPEALRKALQKKGKKNIAKLSDEEIIQTIFDDGLSTKKGQESMLSGRGVGMSAVKGSVEQMGGIIHVSSQTNQGCCFELVVPFLELNWNSTWLSQYSN